MSAAPAAAATSLSLITTASSSTTVGYHVFANVNLMGAGVTPTGTVTFNLHGPADTSCTSSIFTSTVAVTGTSVNSETHPTSQAGTYRWTTSYSGDANYNPSGPTACSYAGAAVVVAKARNVLKVTAQAPVNGLLVAHTTLTGFSPTGTVTFYLNGPNDTYCSGAVLATFSVSVSGTGTYYSAAFDPSVSGTYRWRATYSGDDNNRGASITSCSNYNAWVTV